MRISDWSSDVCSSDLAIGQPNRKSRRFVGFRQFPVGIIALDVATECPDVVSRHCIRHGACDDIAFPVAGDGSDIGFKAQGDAGDTAIDRRLGDLHFFNANQAIFQLLPFRLTGVSCLDRKSMDLKLGRASLRARMCPYVYITVVAVSLKKKKK